MLAAQSYWSCKLPVEERRLIPNETQNVRVDLGAYEMLRYLTELVIISQPACPSNNTFRFCNASTIAASFTQSADIPIDCPQTFLETFMTALTMG